MGLELITDREFALNNGMEVNVFVDFMATPLKGDQKEGMLIKSIDKAEQIKGDPYSVIDRFGNKIAITDLSTGCLIALAVLRNPNTIICGLQLGDNALEALIRVCNTGRVFIYDREYSIDSQDSDIDVLYKSKRYRKSGDLRQAMEGIVCLS